ncbi:hypothetical protein [Nesterenkonia pannonica]|uniref:hypothetical protein n=1 Tax=Nesterenkonia pannonica TaxID=1548602 RepID=UPI002164B056|nr:hypothetical protein [Nesterenkonia pannonica]
MIPSLALDREGHDALLTISNQTPIRPTPEERKDGDQYVSTDLSSRDDAQPAEVPNGVD